MLLRRCNESRTALRILPDNGDFSRKPRARGRGLEGSVILYLVRIGKRDQQGGPPDIQMSNRNRTI